MDLICRIVEKIVFSGINGKILILPLIFLLWFGIGQAKDFIYVAKKILKEEDLSDY